MPRPPAEGAHQVVQLRGELLVVQPAVGAELLVGLPHGELDVDDVGAVDEMCRKLLANPLIEDYEIVG